MTYTGRVLKGIGGFYTVCDEEGVLYTCMARGKFRKDKLTPTVGDYVEFDPGSDTQEGYLLRILPRKNQLRRPPVSNIDLVAVVVALMEWNR
jgi:ribosome biogenesis GTPase